MHFVEMETLETPRLVLRKLSMDDLYDYYERIGSDGEVSKFMLWQPHQDIGETLEVIEQALAQYEAGGYYRWVFARKEDDRIIGTASLLRIEEATATCSFAYMVAKEFWNQGYATEALQAIFDFAFHKLGIEKITADHMTPNAASGAVMRKLGMRHVGTEKDKYEKFGRKFDAEVYELNCPKESTLTVDEYQHLAMECLSPALSRKDILINGVMGLCGESGEAIDIVKKHLYQGHPLDREKLIDELGDVAWYLAETAYALQVDLETILLGNIRKLKERYPEGFDPERSIHR